MASSRASRGNRDNDSPFSNQGSIPHSRSSQEGAQRNPFEDASSSRERLVNPFDDEQVQRDDEAVPSASDMTDELASMPIGPEGSQSKGKAPRSPVHAAKDVLSLFNNLGYVNYQTEPIFRWTIPFEPKTKNEALKLSGRNLNRTYHCTGDELTTLKARNEINKILGPDPAATETSVAFRLKGPFEGKAIDDAVLCFTIMKKAGVCLRPKLFEIHMLYKHGLDAEAEKAEKRRVKGRLAELAKDRGCEIAVQWRDLAR